MTIQAYGWRDMRMIVSGAASGSGTPTPTAFGPSGNIKQTAFGVGDSVYLTVPVDHDAWVGAMAYPRICWSTNGVSVNSVKWEMRYIYAAGYNTANFGADVLITFEEAAAGTAWRHMTTQNTGFVLPQINSMVICELKRVTNGGSENADTVFGLYLGIHYPTSQLATKNRTPNFFT